MENMKKGEVSVKAFPKAALETSAVNIGRSIAVERMRCGIGLDGDATWITYGSPKKGQV